MLMYRAMREGREKAEAGGIKRGRDCLLFTVCFFFAAFLFLLFYCLNGVTFIHQSDPYNQDYPIFLYLGKCLRNLIFNGEITTYDFMIGLGENVIAPLNLYGFGDPLNVLSVFAAGKGAEYLYAFLLLFRMYLAGIGMILYFRSHGHEGLLSVGGAVVYALSQFAIVKGLYFYQILNAAYLLPFLLVQLDNLIFDRKRYRSAGKLAVLIAIQTCCCFYFLYIQTWFLFFYAVFAYFNTYGKKGGLSLFFRRFFTVLGSYLLGVAASGLILFPTLHGFFNSSRTTEGFAGDRRLLFSMEELSVFFGNLMIPMTNTVNNFGLGIPVVCVLTCIIVLGLGEKGKSLCLVKAAVILSAAGYVCPLFWSVSNGFSYAADRWHYQFYFVMAYAAVTALEYIVRSGAPKGMVWLAGGIAVCSVVLHFCLNMDKIRSLLYLALAVVMTVCILRGYLNEKLAFGFLYGGAALNILFILGPWQACGHDFWNEFCTREEIGEFAVLSDAMSYDRFTWERKDIPPAVNSIVTRRMGVSEYYSILNGNTFRFWEELSVSPGIPYMPHHIKGLDGRAALESLLGVSEYMDGERLVQNPYALPLGVEYTGSCARSDFERLQPLQKQEVLLQSVVIDGGSSLGLRSTEGKQDARNEEWSSRELAYTAEYQDMDIREDSADCGEGAALILTVDTQEIEGREGELYVAFPDFDFENGQECLALNVAGKEVWIQKKEWRYYMGIDDFLVHVSDYEDGRIRIAFLSECKIKLPDIKVFWYDYEGMGEKIDKLREHTLENVSFANGRVSGEIDAKGGWLFFAIPYTDDWHIYVDGQEEALLQANVGFMAAALEQGYHTVELRYQPRWMLIGAVSSLLGVGGIVAVLAMERVKPAAKKE